MVKYIVTGAVVVILIGAGITLLISKKIFKRFDAITKDVRMGWDDIDFETQSEEE